MKTLNLILTIVAVLLVSFIGVMCYFFYRFQAIPDTLCTCVLGTGTAELLASAAIQIFKKKGESHDNFSDEKLNL